jgi:hypothetical protein
MPTSKGLLSALLDEMSEEQRVLTLRFVLHALSRDDLSSVDQTLRAVATFDLSHLVHLACLLDEDNKAELVFRAEDLLRAQHKLRVV